MYIYTLDTCILFIRCKITSFTPLEIECFKCCNYLRDQGQYQILLGNTDIFPERYAYLNINGLDAYKIYYVGISNVLVIK